MGEKDSMAYDTLASLSLTGATALGTLDARPRSVFYRPEKKKVWFVAIGVSLL